MAEAGGWFHCGRCGNLFRGVVGQSCPDCGGHPVVEEKELAFLQVASQFRAESQSKPGVPTERKPSRKKRRKKGGLMYFVIGWIVFLGLLAALVNTLRRRDGDGPEVNVTELAEENRLLNAAYQRCHWQVGEFLKDATPEERVKVVHDPVGTLRQMVRFGGVSLRLAADETWEWKRFEAIGIGGKKAYEGVVAFADGRRAEFVFLPDDKGHLGIDWANLVRYSDHPWPLFLSGDTAPVGEFRLLVRRRAGSSGQVGDVTSIVLIAPEPWDPVKIGVRSPEVEIAAGSREARMLEQAFEDREEGRGAFGSKLQVKDPISMVRVRVKLRRFEPTEEGEAARFEIEELLGCHWMSVDDPGVGDIDE